MDQINNVSNEAVKGATGKGWEEWIKLLDKKGAVKMSHREIAKLLSHEGLIKSGWWCQQVTVGYEYAKGRRVVGQTEDAGFEVGAQKTIYASADKVWKLITSPVGYRIWLGDLQRLNLKPKSNFKTKEGITGEVRTIKKGERLRLTWQPENWAEPSTLQVTVSCPRNTKDRTTLHFHQEKLSGAITRKQMRTRWQKVAQELKDLIEG